MSSSPLYRRQEVTRRLLGPYIPQFYTKIIQDSIMNKTELSIKEQLKHPFIDHIISLNELNLEKDTSMIMQPYPDLKIKLLFPDARVPVRTNLNDSGADVFIYKFEKQFVKGFVHDEERILENPGTRLFPDSNDKVLILEPGQRVLINCGISATVGDGYEIQVRPRSGLALKQGLTVLNSPGTIDSDYRGFVGVIVINHSNKNQSLNIGDKIAQIVVAPVILSPIVIVEDLDQTARGEKGFGSSGT